MFRFINMAKAHTPKVTLYTSRAKCILMERVEPQADFELELLADGSRVILLGGESAGTVQVITQTNGTLTYNLKQPLNNPTPPPNVQDLITYAESVSYTHATWWCWSYYIAAIILRLSKGRVRGVSWKNIAPKCV